MAQTLYVNPATGSDSAAGSQSAPLKTLTKALNQAQSGTQIQVAAGNYNAANGEVFPLQVPSGVKVVGNEQNKGTGILIEGSGQYNSRTQAGQNVTILLATNAELRGISATNPASRGTAVWIESTAPTVANCTFTKCKREGVFATGDANPIILNNVFINNDGNGISFTKNSLGEINGNTCKNAGSGISLDGNATPEVCNNIISDNRYGIIVSGESRPIFRNNVIENNSDTGLSVTGKALPDLGIKTEPGNNIFRNNTQFDLQNSTSTTLISIGNQLTISKVKGLFEIDGSPSPSPSPTPTPGPSPSPTPGPSPSPTPGPSPSPTPGPSPSPTPTPTELTDIKGHWAEPFIEILFDEGVISGFKDGTFKPDAKMTRAEYAALLVKAFNPAPKRDAKNFTDVAANFWAKDVIQQAYRGQFLSGLPDGTFRPTENVQRVQVIVSLVNGLGLVSPDMSVLNFYNDRSAIPDYAKDEVATATKKKMVVNYPQLKQLNPTRDATRAEVAAMVYQALVDANQMSPINSPYIVFV